MALRKVASSAAAKKTERVTVWLDPDQAAWLKSKKNVSQTLKALVTEAISLERLAESVKKGKAKTRK